MKFLYFLAAGSITTNRSPPAEQNQHQNDSPPQQNNFSNGAGPLDFNAELTKKLTLKRQKQQPSQQVIATEANLKTNRGPPPQPPGQKNLSSVCVFKSYVCWILLNLFFFAEYIRHNFG